MDPALKTFLLMFFANLVGFVVGFTGGRMSKRRTSGIACRVSGAGRIVAVSHDGRTIMELENKPLSSAKEEAE